ncbi:hypothetical protein ACFPIJ_57355 [Dactylosporangium cerinum]|uniref:IrrE N-terminal-like domain-containing protein n=1 Tax=Dactylosporangium cerinum TaxID=1434730 RepID=A0ABV9WK20_9ACTN
MAATRSGTAPGTSTRKPTNAGRRHSAPRATGSSRPGSSRPDNVPRREDRLEEFQAALEARLAGMATDPRQWVEFVEQVAVFGARYSVQNQLLLTLQAAERGVTPVFFLPYGNKAGTSGWRLHGRQVKAGEHAFLVWAPVRRRPSEEQAAQLAAAGRTVLRDAGGRPAPQVVGFRPMATFELSQTDGAPFEPPTVDRARRAHVIGGRRPQRLDGDDPTGVFDDLAALIEAEGFAFSVIPPRTGHLGRANGITAFGSTRVVQVRNDLSAAQRVATTTHELAHIRCGHVTAALCGEQLHRGRAETEAESVAHVVCAALGLDTRGYSDAYVLGWADGDMDLVRDCADTVRRVSRTILQDLTPADADNDVADDGAGDCDDVAVGAGVAR